MNKKLYYWQTAGFIFVGIMGVLLHFLFDWTGGSVFVAPFSAVNESVWEHMKLIFFPMFIFTFIKGRYIGGEFESFRCVKLIGIALGVVLIPVTYFTLNGIFGRTPDWVNIALFFITAAIVYYVEMLLLKRPCGVKCISGETATVILCVVAVVFAVLTFIPPQIPLFEDPLTGTYGFMW